MSLFPPLFLLKHHIVVLAHKFVCLYCVIWFFHLCFYLCYMNGLSMQLLLLCNVAWGILIHAVWHTYTAPCRTARDVNMSWVAYCMLYELLFCVCGQFCGLRQIFAHLLFVYHMNVLLHDSYTCLKLKTGFESIEKLNFVATSYNCMWNCDCQHSIYYSFLLLLTQINRCLGSGWFCQ